MYCLLMFAASGRREIERDQRDAPVQRKRASMSVELWRYERLALGTSDQRGSDTE